MQKQPISLSVSKLSSSRQLDSCLSPTLIPSPSQEYSFGEESSRHLPDRHSSGSDDLLKGIDLFQADSSDSKNTYIDEIQRLSSLYNQVREENQVLAAKTKDNEKLRSTIRQLTFENQQYAKEKSNSTHDQSSRKSSPQRIISVRTSLEKGTSSQSKLSHSELLSQNKGLKEELAKLKAQFESNIKEKAQLRNKKESIEALESQLRDANAQVEFLNDEMQSKDFEVKALYEMLRDANDEKNRIQTISYESLETLKLFEAKLLEMELEKEKESSRSTDPKNQEANSEQNDDNRPPQTTKGPPEMIKSQDLFTLEKSIDQLNAKMVVNEQETSTLKEDNREKDLEIEQLRAKITEIEAERDLGLKAREEEMERNIKSKSNEAIKLFLKEKVHYEKKIFSLSELIKTMEEEGLKAKEDYHTKLQQRESSIEDLRRRLELEQGMTQKQQVDEAIVTQSNGKDYIQVLDGLEQAQEFTLNNGEGIEKEGFVGELPQGDAEKDHHLDDSLEDNRYRQDKVVPLKDSRAEPTSKLSSNERLTFESQISALKDELNDLKAEHIECLKELNDLRKKLKAREENLVENERLHIESLTKTKREAELLKDIIDEMEEKMRLLKDENSLVLSQTQEKRARFEELEGNASVLIKEKERLKASCNQRVERYKLEVLEKKKTIDDMLVRQKELESEIAEVKHGHLDTREMAIKHSFEKRQLGSEINQLKGSIKDNKDELEKLYELLDERKKECEVYSKQNIELLSENERLRSFEKNLLEGSSTPEELSQTL